MPVMVVAKADRVHHVPSHRLVSASDNMGALIALLIAAIEAVPIPGPDALAEPHICRVSLNRH